MTILITDALQQTTIVAIALVLTLAISLRHSKNESFFPLQTTTELKGLAILMVILSHIGYFLVSDRRFLVPMSNYAGVGVDLFLVLSGYGLVASALKKNLSIGRFYLKRLSRIYVPAAITVILFLLLDYFFLHKIYPLKTIIENILGFFPRADLYQDINSPLWFITPLLVYYLMFPLIFWKRFPAASAVLPAIIGWLFIVYSPQFNIVSIDMIKMYKLHFLSFPIGMAIGAMLNQPPLFIAKYASRLSAIIKQNQLSTVVSAAIIFVAASVLVFMHFYSYVGESWIKEVMASLISVIAIMLIFLFKKTHFKALVVFGAFSFEIYLLHWPILYRYNFLYGKLPAGIATILYLSLLFGLGYAYQKAFAKIFQSNKK